MSLDLYFARNKPGHFAIIFNRGTTEFWSWLSAGRVQFINDEVDAGIRRRTAERLVGR